MVIIGGVLMGLVFGVLELLQLPGPWTQCFASEVREALLADGLVGLALGLALAGVFRLLHVRPRPATVARFALAGAALGYVGLNVAVGRVLGGPALPDTTVAFCLALALPLVGMPFPSAVRRTLTALTVLAAMGGALVDLADAPAPRTPAPVASGAPHRPNVVVIVWDATRRDHVGAQGYAKDTTPFLSELARTGVVYEDAYSPATWTVPSHASLFTGLYPSIHGTDDEHEGLASHLPTLAETLSAAGYETAAFVANPFLATGKGFAQGFDTFFEGWRRRRLLADVVTRQWRVLLARQTDKGSELVLSAVDRWLAERDPSRPYFLFINVLDAHPNLWPVQPFRSRFLGSVSGLRAALVPQRHFALLAGLVHLTDEDREIVSDLFDGEIAYLDTVTARLHQRLVAHGGDDMLLLVTSDHGDWLGADGLLGPIGFSEDLAKNYPFVIRMPGVFDGGKRRTVPVSLVDVAPTILDVVGLPRDAMGQLSGRSLLALDHDGVIDRTVLAENEVRFTTIHEADAKYGHHPAWLDLRSKGAWSRRAGIVWTSDGATALRDDQPADTADDRTGLVTSLEQQIVAAVGAPTAPTQLVREHRFEPAAREQLRALGYVH